MRNYRFLHSTILAAMLAGAIPAGARQAVPAPAIDRTLAFDAREGTWMAPSLSPDGRTILFDILGDIYAVAASGAMPDRSCAAPRSRCSRSGRPTAPASPSCRIARA
ncbi:hypothetical protein [Sphingomonas hankookensis]|uniref:hypothetical protein n=1 Tax=Sphingomonas hankookensis TaxID=563996 RepID=UPI003D302B4A